METDHILDAALRKAAAIWITVPGHRPRLVWALWRGKTLWLAVGGTEQQIPGLTDGTECTVTLRSPSTHSHLLDVTVTARLAEPGDETVVALKAARLNASPRWESAYRLELRGSR